MRHSSLDPEQPVLKPWDNSQHYPKPAQDRLGTEPWPAHGRTNTEKANPMTPPSPDWRSVVRYFPLMLVVLWLWQDVAKQLIRKHDFL